MVYLPEFGAHACAFIEQLAHVKGRWAGTKIKLEPFQVFLVTSLFSWYFLDGRRRYRTAFIQVARKNAKSTLGSGIALYMLCADGEGGADVYAFATKRDQAKIVFGDAQAMARGNKKLLGAYGLKVQHNKILAQNNCTFSPLSSQSKTADGLNVHGAIGDEIHAHRDSSMLDVIDTGTGARNRALIFLITTAGSTANGVGHGQYQYACGVAEGTIHDDRYFPLVYELDNYASVEDGGEYGNTECYVKANPNLGVSVDAKDLSEQVEKGRHDALAAINVRTKHFNQWVSSSSMWLQSDWVDGCGSDASESEHKGSECIMAIDYASRHDCVSICANVRTKDGYRLFFRHLAPEVMIRNQTSPLWAAWVRDGNLIAVPGEVVEHTQVLAAVDQLREFLKVKECAFDRYQFTSAAAMMESEGVNMVEFPQKVATMSEPMKELGALLAPSRRGIKFSCPVFSWMLKNVSCRTDRNGNIYPLKPSDGQKIDGAVACIMTLGRYIWHDVEAQKMAEERKNHDAAIARAVGGFLGA